MEEMTEYERRRLENMRRNQEMLAALQVESVAQELRSAAAKKPKKRPASRFVKETTEPTVIRRSLRTRGIKPEMDITDLTESPSSHVAPKTEAKSFSKDGPLSFLEAYVNPDQNNPYLNFFRGVSERAMELPLVDLKGQNVTVDTEFRVGDLKMEEKDKMKVVPSRIFSLQFLPFRERTILVTGDKEGYLSFWDADADSEEERNVYAFWIHSSPITHISVAPFSTEKVLSCSYDGSIRIMDLDREIFDVLHKSDVQVFSISCPMHNHELIYFASGLGDINVFDQRTGSVNFSYELHQKRINTVDCHPQNQYLIATSSTDCTASIWDIRKLKRTHNKSLATIDHKKAVHSAYFSPTGSYLSTTGLDNKIGLLSLFDTQKITMISHEHPPNRWLSTFRAIWGWNDQYILIGNMRRGLDAICTSTRKTSSFYSSVLTAIPTRLTKHPLNYGVLAGGTAGGYAYIWRKE